MILPTCSLSLRRKGLEQKAFGSAHYDLADLQSCLEEEKGEESAENVQTFEFFKAAIKNVRVGLAP